MQSAVFALLILSECHLFSRDSVSSSSLPPCSRHCTAWHRRIRQTNVIRAGHIHTMLSWIKTWLDDNWLAVADPQVRITLAALVDARFNHLFDRVCVTELSTSGVVYLILTLWSLGTSGDNKHWCCVVVVCQFLFGLSTSLKKLSVQLWLELYGISAQHTM